VATFQDVDALAILHHDKWRYLPAKEFLGILFGDVFSDDSPFAYLLVVKRAAHHPTLMGDKPIDNYGRYKRPIT